MITLSYLNLSNLNCQLCIFLSLYWPACLTSPLSTGLEKRSSQGLGLNDLDRIRTRPRSFHGRDICELRQRLDSDFMDTKRTVGRATIPLTPVGKAFPEPRDTDETGRSRDRQRQVKKVLISKPCNRNWKGGLVSRKMSLACSDAVELVIELTERNFIVLVKKSGWFRWQCKT
jgi:hypothetical protein